MMTMRDARERMRAQVLFSTQGVLQTLRKLTGLTQKEAGELVHVSEITVRLWESGKRTPKPTRQVTYITTLSSLIPQVEDEGKEIVLQVAVQPSMPKAAPADTGP